MPPEEFVSFYPPPEGNCGWIRFDIQNNDITNWDKPWLSELDITSVTFWKSSFFISDFSVVDFRFSGIAISDFRFQNSEFGIAISKVRLIMARKSNIYNNQNLGLKYIWFRIFFILESGKHIGSKASWFI